MLPKVDASTSRSIAAIGVEIAGGTKRPQQRDPVEVSPALPKDRVVNSASSAPSRSGRSATTPSTPVGESKRSARKRSVGLPDRLQYRQHPSDLTMRMRRAVGVGVGGERLRGTGGVVSLFVEHGNPHAARGDQIFQSCGVVLGPAFQRDQKNLAAKSHAPMQIADVIAELDGIADRARLEAKPALGRRPHHDGAIVIEQQHGTVEQLLMTRQRDCEFLAAAGRDEQSSPREVGDRHVDVRRAPRCSSR